MKEIIHTVPCNCGGKIIFQPRLLWAGESFTCPSCQGVLSMVEKSRPLYKETYEKFEQLDALSQNK